MYYLVNWPRVVRLPELGSPAIHHVKCNRDKILIAVLSPDTLTILYNKPCVPVACFKRDSKSLEQYGENMELEWKPDSAAIAVLTSKGYLSFYEVKFQPNQHVYEQVDSDVPGFRRESAELFVKDHVPLFSVKLAQTIPIDSGGTTMACIRDELMVATKYGHVLRLQWNGNLNRDYCLDLRRIPCCIDQLSSKAVPITEPNTYITEMDYSPLLGGFAVVLNDGRAAFLTATTLKFDPNQVQGIWAPLEDVTCTSINHRYRLIAYGRHSSHGCVYTIDESTGGLQLSHTLQLSDKDYPGPPGPVQLLRWSPDGCCLAMAWTRGGVSLWSTFGALLLCTLNWDYGVSQHYPLAVRAMDWGIEGYQLWVISSEDSSLLQYELVKSPLTANPCMNAKERLYLHGQDRIYINISDANPRQSASPEGAPSALLSNKQWHIVQVPASYMGGNWPLRFAALDAKTEYVAVAGRTGVAIYSRFKRRWKLFGNESQERDFVVTGGLLWSGTACGAPHLVMGCYNITSDRDEIRLYPRDAPRLDNSFAIIQQVNGQILLLSLMGNTLLVYTSDCHITLFELEASSNDAVLINRMQEIDVSTLRLHPACIVAATLTSLSHATEIDQLHTRQQNILLNVCGRVLLIQRNDVSGSASGDEGEDTTPYYAAPTVLASSVEILWVPNPGEVSAQKPHLTQALWLCCGAHGMRVWLPLFPREGDKGQHAFMSKRIMLPFQLNIYPLSVLFEEAILIGVETDTVPYPLMGNRKDLGPLCVLERNSQVYLHHIFRQLIRRNLGYHAWEIARGCTDLPYFSHSLELLLHEVLEEEATSKDPIPDALLPSVLQFIDEFPVYLATVVQCARKTEVALWPYLFGVGAIANPRQLFQRCLDTKQLELAASYLIILQNMEPVSVSRQSAIVLLDAALETRNWDLAKDLIRFLRAIDPSDVEPSTPTASWKPGSAPSPAGALLSAKIGLGSQTPPVSPNPEDFNFLLGSTVHRPGSRTAGSAKSPQPDSSGTHHQVGRSISDSGKSSQTPPSKEAVTPGSGKTVARKRSAPANTSPITINADPETGEQAAEEFFMDVILQRHVRRLLSTGQLKDLGFMAAALDCNMVAWLGKERARAARIDDFVGAIQRVHSDFSWHYPHAQQSYRKISVAQEVSLEEKLQALEVDVNVAPQSPLLPDRDSSLPFLGKGSAIGTHRTGSPTTPSNGGLLLQTVEAQLQPHAQDEWTIQSEADVMSLTGEDRMSELDTISINDPMLNLAMAASDGASSDDSAQSYAESEAQLKYLLQQFTEADCLDWALVLAFVLRDAMAVLRLVNMARSAVASSQSPQKAAAVENVTRLRDGLLAISYWVDTDCSGYKPFMNVIYSQVSTLTKLIIPSNGPSSSPKLVNETSTSDKSPTTSSVSKLRNSSAPALTTLDRVAEEGVVPVFQANGKVDLPIEETRYADVQQAPTFVLKEPVVHQRSLDRIQAAEDKHQQMPHSSSCVIS